MALGTGALLPEKQVRYQGSCRRELPPQRRQAIQVDEVKASAIVPVDRNQGTVSGQSEEIPVRDARAELRERVRKAVESIPSSREVSNLGGA